MGFINTIANFVQAVRNEVMADSLKPAVIDFCDKLSNPLYTDTCLNDNSLKHLQQKTSEAVLRDFQSDEGQLQWTHVAETLMDAIAYCSDNSFYTQDDNRFSNLYNYASDIRRADNPSENPPSIRLGIDDYSPIAFLLKFSECQNVAEFRNVFINESRSRLSRPVFSGQR